MTYPVIMISFDNDIFDNHFYIQMVIRTTTCLNTLPTWAGFRVILTLTYIPQPWLCNKIDRIWHILLWTCHCHFIQHHALHWYLTCIFISAFSLYLCWHGLRYQCYGPDCYQMTEGNTGLSPYLWSATYSVIGNSIWYDLQNDMIAIFLFPCCFNHHLKLHTFSHEIKSNRNKYKIMEHHLSTSISTLNLLDGL